jgi:hypothetical protein
MSRWLLARRGSDDPDDLAFYQAYGPEDTSLEELIRVCQERWAIEFAFEEAKGEIGMDHYEVRKWGACHRYVTLCLLAHAFLVVTRLAARKTKKLPVKRDSWVRSDPADGAGGKERFARHGRAGRREEGLPARVVGMETGTPGRGQALQEGEPGRQTRISQRKYTRGENRAACHDSLPRKRRLPMQSGRWSSPSSHRGRLRDAGKTFTARCWAASCG